MLTVSVNRDTMNVNGLMKPCHSPSQNPATSPLAAAVLVRSLPAAAHPASSSTAPSTRAVRRTRPRMVHHRVVEGCRRTRPNTRGARRSSPRGPDAAAQQKRTKAVSYTHLRAHETRHDLVCRLLLEKKK